jgi:methyl-accepting chemotaxis protein
MTKKMNRKSQQSRNRWNRIIIWSLLTIAFIIDYILDVKPLVYVCLGIIAVGFGISSSHSKRMVNQALEEAQQERERINMILNRVRKGTSAIDESNECLFEQLKETADISDQIHVAFEDVAKGSEHQLKGTNTIHEATNALYDKLNKTYQMVKNMRGIGLLTTEKTNEGNEKVYSFEKTIKDVNKTMTLAFEVMTELRQKSESIKKIVSTIQDFSNKTNALSLNATIESAISYEQSSRKLTSLVNDIRTLSEEAGKATKEISEQLNDVSSGTELVNEKLERGNQLLTESIQSTKEVTDVFGSIVKQADDLFFSVSSLEEELDELISESQIVLESVNVVSSAIEKHSAHAEKIFTGLEKQGQNISDVFENQEQIKKSITDLKTI